MKQIFLALFLVLSLTLLIGCSTTTETATTTTTTAATTTTTTTTTTIPSVVNITGTISWEGFNNLPLGGVVVSLESETRTTTTDANGQYSFSSVEAGTHTLTFYQTGWTFYPSNESITVSDTDVTQNATAELTDWSIVDLGTTNDIFDVHALCGDFTLVALGCEAGEIFFNPNVSGVELPNPIPNVWVNPTATTTESFPFVGWGDSVILCGQENAYIWQYDINTELWSEFIDGGSLGFLSLNNLDTENEFLLTADGILISIADDAPEDPTILTDVNNFFALSSTEVLAVIDNGLISITVDTGQNWTTGAVSPAEDLSDISSITHGGGPSYQTSSNVWLVSNTGSIWFSDDRGDSWGSTVSGIPVQLNAITSAGPEVSTAESFVVGNDGLVLRHK
ncbi:MAG: carboxypeptidase regulatory-like domain-containing protein [bacterium]